MSVARDECLWPSRIKESDSNEDKVLISCVFDPPSLKSIALVVVAVRLWGYPDWGEDWKYPDPEMEEDCPSLGKGALKRLNEIYLPKSLKLQVSNIIRPIGLQWIKFLEYAEMEYYAEFCNLNQLYQEGISSYWTIEGTLDRVRLLKDIIKEAKKLNAEEFDFIILYENACILGLEEDILELWLKVSSCQDIDAGCFAGMGYLQHIVAYWTASLNNELPSLMSKLKQYDKHNIYKINLGILENMISSFVASGNAIALKHFWHKLTEEEKNANIDNWIVLVMEILKKKYNSNSYYFYSFVEGEEYADLYHFIYQDSHAHTDIMYFLLSHLNSQTRQKECLQHHGEVILHSLFSHWPLQRFFLPTVFAMLDFINEGVYVRIMDKIANSVIKRRTESFLREIWMVSARNLKEAFIHFISHRPSGIIQLLTVGDDVAVDMILNYAPENRKKYIVLGMAEESIFRDLLYSNKLAISALDRFVSKYLSQSDLQSFKQSVMQQHARKLGHDWILTADFSALDEFEDWASQSSTETHQFKQNYINIMDIYKSLILLGNYEHVDDFLNWYFEVEEEVFKFKKFFVHEDNLEECKCLMRSWSNKGKDGWDLFEKFQNFTFDSPDEITQFKKLLASGFEWFFMAHKSEFGDLFQKWCDNTPKDVK